MRPAPLLTLGEVAGYWRLTPDRFARTWQDICDRHGFPRPLQSRPYLWSPVAIAAWEISKAPHRLRPHIAAATGEADTTTLSATQALEARYGTG